MYSLWLTPDKICSEELSILITSLAKELNGPLFAPHVNLLGKISGADGELEKSTHKLAKQLTPIKICSSKIDYEESFYKSLFIDLAPSKELDRAHLMAKGLFKLSGYYHWQPHLSLLYGRQAKEEKVHAINNILPHKEFTINLDSLKLISGFGPPEKWYTITEFKIC